MMTKTEKVFSFFIILGLGVWRWGPIQRASSEGSSLV